MILSCVKKWVAKGLVQSERFGMFDLFNMKSTSSKVGLAVLFLISALIFVYIFIVSTNMFKENSLDEKSITKVTLKNCDIQKAACLFSAENIILEISMDKDIYYLKPFNLSVKRLFNNSSSKDNSNIESIAVDFKMKNMNMGVNRFQLKKVKLKNDDYAWKGKALLPICVTGRADWVSELDILTTDSHYRLIFPVLVKQAPYLKH